MLFIETTKEKASQSIVYTENSEVDYRVYLKDNDFFQKGYLEKDNQYIASLIDYIKVDFEYLLESEEKNVDYNYVYKVVAETNVEEKSNNNSLYNFTEDLIEEKEYTFFAAGYFGFGNRNGNRGSKKRLDNHRTENQIF